MTKVRALFILSLLFVTLTACDEQRGTPGVEPSEDGTCYPAYNEDGEPERGAAGQECYSFIGYEMWRNIA